MSRIARTLTPARRYGTFALLAALVTLTGAALAFAQEPDRDGDGRPDSMDQCPDEPATQPPGHEMVYGCPPAPAPAESDGDGDGVGDSRDSCPDVPADAHPMPYRPGCPGGGDGDGDGVIDANDSCPYEGGRVGQNGCPLPPDRDGDGVTDEKDGCPDEPTNEYSDSRYGPGCPGPAPFSEPDTPPASGPSCTKKQPCVVLERRGLSEKMNGGYIDADAVVKVTIARGARGVPARVIEVELRNVDSRCTHFDEKSREYSSTPGPEVSVTLDSPLALKKSRQRHGGGGFSNVFRFDPMRPIRTIKGLKYELSFGMYEDDDASKAELSVSRVGASGLDECSINIYGNNDPVTDGVCRTDDRGSEDGACEVAEMQSIDDLYERGQALYFDCGASFTCPAAKNVDVKITVIKSVAKALGLKSTTISGDKAVGPKQTKLDGEKGTYYFVPLRDDVVRKMKAKKVRSVTVTVSGAATGPDGARRFAPTRVEWHVDGNCGGLGLEMKKHVTYGGKCSARQSL